MIDDLSDLGPFIGRGPKARGAHFDENVKKFCDNSTGLQHSRILQPTQFQQFPPTCRKARFPRPGGNGAS